MATTSFFSHGNSESIDPKDFNQLVDTLDQRNADALANLDASQVQLDAATLALANTQVLVLQSETNAQTAASNAATSEANASTSEANALTYKNAAQTAATNAAASQTSASTSAANAATSEANSLTYKNAANTSATNAAASESNALSYKTAANTSATNAATSEANALTSKNAAATSATNASNSASSAATSESNALTYKNNAATSASNASISEGNALASKNLAATSAGNAAISETNAASSLTSFKRQYQGALSSAPTLRYDGTALQTGDLYFDTTNSPQPSMKVYTGTAWINAGSTINATSKRQAFTAAAGQTTFAITGGYDAGFADVFVNGLLMTNGTDVDVTSGTNAVLTEGCAGGENVYVVCYGAFSVANTYTIAQVDAKIGTAGPLVFKNRLRNGNGKINQRGGTGGSTDGIFVADGWGAYQNIASLSGFFGANNFSNNPSLTGGASFGLSASASATKSVLAAGDYFFVSQRIEGLNMADLQWGTASAKSTVLSFRAWATQATTLAVSISNGATTRSYVTTVSLASGMGSYSVVIPGCTDGVWATDNTFHTQISFVGAAGSSLQAPSANSWTSGNYRTVAGASNILDTLSRAFSISDVQYEVGTVATTYAMTPYALELTRCERYCRGFATTFITRGSDGGFASGYAVQGMRTTPTVTNLSSTFTTSYNVSSSVGSTGGVLVFATGTGTVNASGSAIALLTAEL